MMGPEKMDNQGLRSFGLIFGVILVTLFGLLLPWVFDHAFPFWPWYIAVPVWVLAIIAPSLLAPFFAIWMKFGLVLGWINTRIILGFVFFVVVLPISLILRLFGKDPMKRHLDEESTTYRVTRTVAPEKNHVERPF